MMFSSISVFGSKASHLGGGAAGVIKNYLDFWSRNKIDAFFFPYHQSSNIIFVKYLPFLKILFRSSSSGFYPPTWQWHSTRLVDLFLVLLLAIVYRPNKVYFVIHNPRFLFPNSTFESRIYFYLLSLSSFTIHVLSRYHLNNLKDYSFAHVQVHPNPLSYEQLNHNIYPSNKNLCLDNRNYEFTLASKSDLKINLCSVGQLLPSKNVELALRIISHLPTSYNLTIFGQGKHIDQLKSLSNSLNISARVCFRGFVPHSQLTGELKDYDILVYTSIYDTQSLVLTEALILSMKCFVPDYPIFRELFGTFNNLVYFDYLAKPSTLAAKIQKFYSSAHHPNPSICPACFQDTTIISNY